MARAVGDGEVAVGRVPDRERARDRVRTHRRHARPVSKAVTTGAQPSACPPKSRGAGPSTSPSVAQLPESLSDLVEERARGDRDHDGVRRLPAELLGDLVCECLRPLGVVRAQVDVDESPRQLERQLHREPGAMVVRAVDRIDAGAVDRCRGELLRLEVGRNEDCRLETFGRGPRCDGACEVAGRRARERLEAELLRLARGNGDDPVLERVRRVRGVELEPQLADAELLRRVAAPARVVSARERGGRHRAASTGAGRRSARSRVGRPRFAPG